MRERVDIGWDSRIACLNLVISSCSTVRVSLDELLRGDILLMKCGSSMCIMVTLYMRMGDIGQSRGCDGEEDKRELHGNVELDRVKAI